MVFTLANWEGQMILKNCAPGTLAIMLLLCAHERERWWSVSDMHLSVCLVQKLPCRACDYVNIQNMFASISMVLSVTFFQWHTCLLLSRKESIIYISICLRLL